MTENTHHVKVENLRVATSRPTNQRACLPSSQLQPSSKYTLLYTARLTNSKPLPSPEKTKRPPSEKCSAVTLALCPDRTHTSSFVSMFQILISLSSPADTDTDAAERQAQPKTIARGEQTKQEAPPRRGTAHAQAQQPAPATNHVRPHLSQPEYRQVTRRCTARRRPVHPRAFAACTWVPPSGTPPALLTLVTGR